MIASFTDTREENNYSDNAHQEAVAKTVIIIQQRHKH
jgi:hypothetical protein